MLYKFICQCFICHKPGFILNFVWKGYKFRLAIDSIAWCYWIGFSINGDKLFKFEDQSIFFPTPYVSRHQQGTLLNWNMSMEISAQGYSNVEASPSLTPRSVFVSMESPESIYSGYLQSSIRLCNRFIQLAVALKNGGLVFRAFSRRLPKTYICFYYHHQATWVQTKK